MATPRPETTFGYWERKNDEVQLLRDVLELGPGPALVTVPDVLHQKLQLRARMIARFIEAHPLLTESRLHDRGLDFDGTYVGYNYQRYDLKVARRRFAPWLYPALSSGSGARHASFGFLAASGMSAVTAALVALDLVEAAPRPLYLAPTAYFETRQLARGYLRHLLPATRLPDTLVAGGVLLLDSISDEDPLAWLGDRDLGPLAAVVFDTTCYDAASAEIGRVTGRCLAAGTPCLLVRSHLKLDSLGMEYGRLGSIALVLPVPCPARRAKRAQALRRGLQDFLVKAGAGLSIPSVIPFGGDPRFRRLNQQRNAAMRDNNLRCAAALKEAVGDEDRAPMRIDAFHHGRFLYLRPPPGGLRGDAPARALTDALCDVGVYARGAPSFGYDFLGVTRIQEDQGDRRWVLRLSLPDYPADLLAPCVETIARFVMTAA